MPKLSPEVRAQRERSRLERRKEQLQETWQAQLDEARQLAPEAKQFVKENPLSDREAWLLFAVVEDAARSYEAGISSSSKAKYFDAIAPRARPTRYGGRTGVTGFCSKMVQGAFERLVAHRINGYIWPEKLGIAVVLYLRERFPALRPEYPVENTYEALELGAELRLPNLQWRNWMYRDIVSNELV